jgi:prepilin-type N-terminal cleavage/methylation domain-containing protein
MLPDTRSCSGFTLLEVLVALTLLGAGVLGLSASATLVSRMIGDGSRLTLAATVATARLEQLRALPCTSATSGSATTRGIDERWSVTPIGGSEVRALEVELSVTYRVRASHAPSRTRTQLFRGAVPCAA